MYNHAIISTKAWPLHKGHEYLISEALRLSRRVTVLLVWAPYQQPWYTKRAQWVRDTFPSVRVIEVADIFTNDDDPHSSVLWALYAKDILEGDEADVVFSSEPYGERWAQEMGIQHVYVDTRRTLVPISGTKIREDPYLNWQYINKHAQQSYLKRVLVVGAESTGKTTLCQALAEKYGTFYVPEYGRIYVEKLGDTKDAITEEHKRIIFGSIVNKQTALIEKIEAESRIVCFHDTDLYTTFLWYREWQKPDDDDDFGGLIMHAASNLAMQYDLVLISDHDTSWHDDGYREQTDEVRSRFTEEFREFYYDGHVLSGSWREREIKAIKLINGLFEKSSVTLPTINNTVRTITTNTTNVNWQQ